MAFGESLKSSFDPHHHPAEVNTLKSFEDIYKTAYSHGLEAIYAIEKIDLNSIRRISEPQPIKVVAKQQKPAISVQSQLPNQLEFDFGDAYRGWMESFVVREPIQVLGLSRHAEKSLSTNGKMVLRDLIGVDLHSFVFFKGMGQGHIDEIQQKLSQYLNGRVLHQCPTVDMAAWMRSWLGQADRKKVFVCLQPYHLEGFVALSMAENLEVGRLPPDKKLEWTNDILSEIRKEKIRLSINEDLKKIVDVFIKPWMQRRQGMATRQEIMERLQKISDEPELTAYIFDFLSSTFSNGSFPLKSFLYEVDEQLYCSDAHIAANYKVVQDRAHSYFYKSEICYTLSHLVQLMSRELACSWQVLEEGFMEKALRQSSHFHVRKQREGGLMVRLAL